MIRLLAMVFALLSSVVSAQSMVVISGNNDAQACFKAAGWATQIHRASAADVDQCTRALQHEALIFNDRVATFVNRGILQAQQQEYGKALADYRIAEKLKPNSAEVALNIGNLWFVSGRHSEAIDNYTKAIKLMLRSPHIAYFNRAMAFEKTGDLPAALLDYEKTLGLVPEWSQAQKRLKALTERMKRS